MLIHAVVLTPFKTVSESNAREHWARKARRVKAQRSTVYRWLRHLLPLTPPALPLVVTLTRIAPRMLDGDNLQASCKACVDACSDYLSGQGYNKGQDRREGLTWQYAQRRGKPREYGVEILIEQEG